MNHDIAVAIIKIFPHSSSVMCAAPARNPTPNVAITSVIYFSHNIFPAFADVILHKVCSFVLAIFFFLCSFYESACFAHGIVSIQPHLPQ